jgi:hypothetical protein
MTGIMHTLSSALALVSEPPQVLETTHWNAAPLSDETLPVDGMVVLTVYDDALAPVIIAPFRCHW